MDQAPAPNRPLCVDMDGTLLESDTMEDLIVSLLRKKFWYGPALLWWLARGRAYFKRRLAEESGLDVNSLPAHAEFLQYLEKQHAAGRTLVLVSAADQQLVQRVADRFKFFSGAIGSDGRTNLRGEAKLKHLTALYGSKGFDYAGNSHVDYPVWQGSADAIVVNASPSVEKCAREIANVTAVFPPRTSRLQLLKRFLR